MWGSGLRVCVRVHVWGREGVSARFPQEQCGAAVCPVTRQRGSKSKAAHLMNIKQRVLLSSTLPPSLSNHRAAAEAAGCAKPPPSLPTSPHTSLYPAWHKMKGEQKQGEGDRERTQSQQRLLYNSNKHLSSRDICTEWWVWCRKMQREMEWHPRHSGGKKSFTSRSIHPSIRPSNRLYNEKNNIHLDMVNINLYILYYIHIHICMCMYCVVRHATLSNVLIKC